MKQKIKNIQTKTGIPAQLLQRNFIMERFLFRLSQSAYNLDSQKIITWSGAQHLRCYIIATASS